MVMDRLLYESGGSGEKYKPFFSGSDLHYEIPLLRQGRRGRFEGAFACKSERYGYADEMAFLQCDFFSEVLGLSCSMNVILPQRSVSQLGEESGASKDKYPVLWLLHGLSDDHSSWMRRTSIERYVSSLGLAVVMPAVNRSFYVDALNGPAYHTFIAEELPAIARGFFPLSDKREDNYVAGLSMGGYGAMLLGLRYPERYHLAASLSGALDIVSIYERNESEGRRREFHQVFGDPRQLAKSEWNLFHLLEQQVSRGIDLPHLYAVCGTEDFLYPDHLAFKQHCERLACSLDAEEASGAHDWAFWDSMIQRVLQRLPLAKPKVAPDPLSREDVVRLLKRS